jgi:hypothetical protein
MTFYELVDKYQEAKDAKAAFHVFEKYESECTKYDLEVISCSLTMKINFPILKNIMELSNLKTIFQYPNLAFLNKKIFEDMKTGNANIHLDYSISFEANTGSYLHQYLTDKSSVDQKFVSTLTYILDNDLNIDPIFYILENVSKGENSEEFHKNLISLKKLMTCDMEHYKKTKEIKSIFTDQEVEEKSKKDYENITNELSGLITLTKQNHLVLKIILLAIVIARFKYKNNFKQQIAYLIKFMDEKLHSIFLRELNVALNYFEQKQLRFFNKLDNRESFDVVMKNIDNMAWDFTLIRSLEMYMATKPNPEADYFIPFIFTFDKGMIEVLEMFYCKHFLIFHEEKRTVPISHNSLIPKIQKYKLGEYFTEEALLNRLQVDEVNYLTILDELQKEIIKIFKFKVP